MCLPGERRRRMKTFLMLGYSICQTGGWERVAPHWLRMSEAQQQTSRANDDAAGDVVGA